MRERYSTRIGATGCCKPWIVLAVLLFDIILWPVAIKASEQAILLHAQPAPPTSRQGESRGTCDPHQLARSLAAKRINSHTSQDQPVRATWIATVQNADWPSKASTAL